jgi:hypothetical protein
VNEKAAFGIAMGFLGHFQGKPLVTSQGNLKYLGSFTGKPFEFFTGDYPNYILLAGGSTTAFYPSHSNSVGQLVETYVEFHAAASDDKDEDQSCSSGDESTTSDEEEAAAVHDGKEAKAARKGGKPKSAKAATLAGKDAGNQPQQQRRQRQPLGGSDSLDAGAEADQVRKF